MTDILDTRMVVGPDGDLTVVRSDDVEPILEQVAEWHNAGVGKTPDMWFVGQIPLILVEKILNETGVNILRPEGRDLLFRLLNDSDYRKLRIVGGRV
jgi:hypothetical protein